MPTSPSAAAVARAAPPTPRPAPKIRMGSNTTFIIWENNVIRKGVCTSNLP